MHHTAVTYTKDPTWAADIWMVGVVLMVMSGATFGGRGKAMDLALLRKMDTFHETLIVYAP